MSPSKARANEVERTPTMNDVLFRSHERERPDMEWKYMNSDKYGLWEKVYQEYEDRYQAPSFWCPCRNLYSLFL